jgi:hypothetical protein
MKKFSYLAAASVAIIAQAASAQVPAKPMSVKITNQAVTLKVVTPRTAAAAASVTLANGVVWSFDNSGNVASAGATVAGVAVAPGKLTAGMSCVLNGTRTPVVNIIATLAC